MGMSADVFAIGPFRRDLVPYLTHLPERYATTREEAVLIERIFSTEGSHRGRELATCFGIDPWDFRDHALYAERVDIAGLRAMSDPCGQQKSIERFVRLRAAGYRFFFRPNG